MRARSRLLSFAAPAFAALLGACDAGPDSGRGFALPEGDVAAGEAAFARLGCADCHSVDARPALREGVEPVMTVPLGGGAARARTYGELVTSVINPSHRISRRYLDQRPPDPDVSPMRNYNDVMTVAELNDVVAFLQERYAIRPPAGPSYQSYSYPDDGAQR